MNMMNREQLRKVYSEQSKVFDEYECPDVVFPNELTNEYLMTHEITNKKTGEKKFYPPIYPIALYGKKKHSITVEISPELLSKSSNAKIKLSDFKTNPLDDIKKVCDVLFEIRRGDYLDNKHKKGNFLYTSVGLMFVLRDLEAVIISFLKEYRKKWGDRMTAYMMKYYMDDYFNYRMWGPK